MPALTRSQSANKYESKKSEYMETMNKLLDEQFNAIGTENKIKCALNVFKHINQGFHFMLECRLDVWAHHGATIINKVREFYSDYSQNNGWPHLDQMLVKSLMKECAKAKDMIERHLSILEQVPIVTSKYVERYPSRRNVKRVDYAKYM